MVYYIGIFCVLIFTILSGCVKVSAHIDDIDKATISIEKEF
nr:hypothetical protein [uncultured Mediterranean phage uvMED]